ncbi:MAG: DUF1648 domain-containing protein [Planifilum sp.]|jgi:uncharacterized membrane protein
MWSKISRYYPPWLDLLPLLLFVLVLRYIGGHYEQLPALMPTHFGPSGNPDSWSEKSIWSVYGVLIIGFMIYLTVVLINVVLLIRPDNPRQVINITERDKDLLGPTRLEEIRAFTVRGLMAVNLIMAAMTSYLSYASIETALGLRAGLGPLMWIFIAALIFASLYLTIRTLSMSSTGHLRKKRSS